MVKLENFLGRCKVCLPFFLKDLLHVDKAARQVVLPGPLLKRVSERPLHDVLGGKKRILGGSLQDLKLHVLQVMPEVIAFGYQVAIKGIAFWRISAQQVALRTGAMCPFFGMSSEVKNCFRDTSMSVEDDGRLWDMKGHCGVSLHSYVLS